LTTYLSNDTLSSEFSRQEAQIPMPARPAAGLDSDRALASVTLLEPQGARRRRQLVEVAARLIEEEGVDAVRIPRIAELAGVGRTAIYRYFTRREDLLLAVWNDFDERLRERIGPDDFARGLLALGEGPLDVMPPATARLFGAIWDVLAECGPAGLILRAHALVDRGAGARPTDLVDRFRTQWMAVGLSDLEAALISDTASAIVTRLYDRARRGEIERDAALRLGYRALAALVQSLAQSRPR